MNIPDSKVEKFDVISRNMLELEIENEILKTKSNALESLICDLKINIKKLEARNNTLEWMLNMKKDGDQYGSNKK